MNVDTQHKTSAWAVSLARDALVRTNRRAIAMMFVRLSVCQSVWDGRALWSCMANFSSDLCFDWI